MNVGTTTTTMLSADHGIAMMSLMMTYNTTVAQVADCVLVLCYWRGLKSFARFPAAEKECGFTRERWNAALDALVDVGLARKNRAGVYSMQRSVINAEVARLNKEFGIDSWFAYGLIKIMKSIATN